MITEYRMFVLAGLSILAPAASSFAVSYTETVNSSVVGSKFGNTITGSGSKDGFYSGSASTSGTTRGIQGVAEFTGTLETASVYSGVHGIAKSTTEGTGNLTSTSIGGGLRNIFQAIMDGSANVAMASAVVGHVDINAGAGTLTNGSAFYAPSPAVDAGKTIASYYGLWIRGSSISGSIGTNYGIRVDTLNPGTTKYGLYIQSDRTYLGGEVLGAGVSTTAAANVLVKTTSNGGLDASLMRVPQRGNISMGAFTAGTAP